MNYQWLIGGQETQPWEYGINIHELKCSKQIFYSQLWLARPINFVMEHSKKFNTWEINLWGSAAGRKMFWRWIFLTLFYHYLDNVFRQKKSDSAWLLLLLSHFSHVQLLRPHGWKPSRFLCPRDFPGKNTGVGCHFLLQGILLMQESKASLAFCIGRQILYHCSITEAQYIISAQ